MAPLFDIKHRRTFIFYSFGVTRFVAVAFGGFVGCKALNQCHAESASNFEYNRNIVYPQYFETTESPKLNGNSLVRLRNDGRPFELHVMPNRYSFETARLYPLARFVELLGRCTDRWCYVRYGSAAGWLSTDRFLKDPSGSPTFLSQTVEPALPPQTLEPALLPQTTATSLPPQIETDKTGDDHAQVVEIPLPVRKGLLPPQRRLALADIPDVATAKLARPAISHIVSKNYALKEMDGQIFLPVHEDRVKTSRILGTIPFYARNVEALGVCIDDWCLIRRGSLQGWIRQRHLSDEPRITEPRLQLEPVMPVDTLNVYSAPNKEAKLVAKIEPPVTDIEPLESCDEQWCYIRHVGIVGWVDPRYLTRQ